MPKSYNPIKVIYDLKLYHALCFLCYNKINTGSILLLLYYRQFFSHDIHLLLL